MRVCVCECASVLVSVRLCVSVCMFVCVCLFVCLCLFVSVCERCREHHLYLEGHFCHIPRVRSTMSLNYEVALHKCVFTAIITIITSIIIQLYGNCTI